MSAQILEFLGFSGADVLQIVWGILWAGLALITITLLILMRTHWGQARPVSKCVVLSICAHLLLIAYAQVTQLFAPPVISHSAPVNIRLSQIEIEDLPVDESPSQHQPWDQLASSPQSVKMSMPAMQRKTSDRKPGVEPQFAKVTSSRNWQIEPPAIAASTDLPPSGVQAVPVPQTSTQSNIAAKSLSADSPNQLPTPRQSRNTMPALARTPSAARHVTSTPPMANEVRNPNQDVQMLQDSVVVSDAAAATIGPEGRLRASANELEAMTRKSMPEVDYRPSELGNASKLALEATLASLQGNSMQNLWTKRMLQHNLPLPRTSRRTMDDQPLPLIMQARVVDDARSWVEIQGGSPEIEPAVHSALAWLAKSQESDGSWNAVRHGAGREDKVAGHDRQAAGNTADMGITGLATLAFLAKGQTHLEGEYRENVQHALEYLVNQQKKSGALDGQAGTYAKMYCHAMALLAISEAYAMTKDERIRPFLERGLAFTVAAQHPTQGGWRYHPGDRGDMSQFGWQVLALHSAALSGLEIKDSTRQLMTRFLRESSAGPNRGLSAYRPGERASATMTAEALTCRFFLGIENESEQIEDATQFVLSNRPSDTADLYYTYYGTLAMYQAQGDSWKTWADSVQPRLLANQVQHGELAGSWDPGTRWGGYGGRVYSTAMATLSLEVYFRYLPIYRPAEDSRTEVVEKPSNSVRIVR